MFSQPWFISKESQTTDLSANRNFLLFIPAGSPSLRAVISYYASTGTVNSEGDVHINDSLQGLGNSSPFQSGLIFDNFLITYICSSITLMAVALVALSSSPNMSVNSDAEAEIEEEERFHRLGTSPDQLYQLECSVLTSHLCRTPVQLADV